MKGKIMELEIIATYKERPQDFFNMTLNPYDLDQDINHLIDLIHNNYYTNSQFKELIKLSTCILVDDDDQFDKFKRYPLVKKLLGINGKLFFKNGKLQ